MVKLKVCGLTNGLDYTMACALGADYTGFVFYEKSPRFVDPAAVRNFIGKGKTAPVRVGVFVNEEISRVQNIHESAGLNIVQLQGDEDPAYCRTLSLPYWKALRVKDVSFLDEIRRFECDTILLDSFSENSYGGTGKSIDRVLLEKAMESGKRIIVAGGVSVLNVEEIIRMKPFAVDVCSSLEEYPGKKSIEKMKDFFQKIHALKEAR
ncbi:MAG: phosphoribosylanthranilate isomerase [Candidatus Aminicenantales bacterium]